MLVKLLTDFYSDEDITTAKSILYDTAFCSRDTPRFIMCKGNGKNISNIQDIANIFLEMPPSSFSSYVAKDLSRLPPLTMNCFDVASLVKDIESLQLLTSILQQWCRRAETRTSVTLVRRCTAAQVAAKRWQQASQPHTQRASQRNPWPASSKQRQGANAITGTGSFGAIKSAGRGLESVNKHLCYATGEKQPTAGRDTTHRTWHGDDVSSPQSNCNFRIASIRDTSSIIARRYGRKLKRSCFNRSTPQTPQSAADLYIESITRNDITLSQRSSILQI